jgi:hypothetical protein
VTCRTEGLRASSTVALTLRAVHDGDALALADHLAAELGSVCRRWGVDLLDVQTSAERITEGDELSALLPVIGTPEDVTGT